MANGKGNKPYVAEALEPLKIEKSWSEGGLGSQSPKQLQHTTWWAYLYVHGYKRF